MCGRSLATLLLLHFYPSFAVLPFRTFTSRYAVNTTHTHTRCVLVVCMRTDLKYQKYTIHWCLALLCLWQKRTSAAVMVFLLSSLSRLRPFYQMPRDKRKRLLFSSDYILYLYVYYAVTTIGSYVGLMSFVRWRQNTHSIYILSGRCKDNSQPPAGARNVYIIFMHKLSERRKQTRVPWLCAVVNCDAIYIERENLYSRTIQASFGEQQQQ